jgi:VWFA-related protein
VTPPAGLRWAGALVAAALTFAAPRAGRAQAGAPTPAPSVPVPVFAAQAESVEVDVRVTRDGQPVLDLSAAEFDVRDNGRRQPVEIVRAGGSPVHALLVLDRSESMAGDKLVQIKAAARAFLTRLGDGDRATLIAFDYRLGLVAGPAATREAALAARDSLRAEGGTALHDAVYAALTLADPRPGRPIVLVFSDGFDRLSWLPAEQVLAAARAAHAAVYAVQALDPLPLHLKLREASTRFGTSGMLGRPTRGRLGSQRVAPLFEDLARETGGRVWQATVDPDLERAFLEVLADARSRYVLRYEPDDTTPGWHKLEVRVTRGRTSVRTRRGYTRAGTAPSVK